VLGTTGTKLIDREWIIFELNRHRHVIGECLGSFANSFPIAFLESEFNFNNKYSIMFGLSGSNLSEHSLEGQGNYLFFKQIKKKRILLMSLILMII
jgi:hypothetical protein